MARLESADPASSGRSPSGRSPSPLTIADPVKSLATAIVPNARRGGSAPNALEPSRVRADFEFWGAGIRREKSSKKKKPVKT
jgi:hypothetical protein